MTAEQVAIDIPARRLPGSDGADSRDWRADSVCRQYPTKWWFAGSHQETLLAKSTCAACGVQAACLEFALSRSDLLGIWAATTPSDRAAMRRGDFTSPRVVERPAGAGAVLVADSVVGSESGAAAGVGVAVDGAGEPTPEPEAVSAPAPDPKGNSRRGPRRGIGRDPVAGERVDLLTPAEAARKLGVTPNTVTRWSRAGKISAIHTMGGHRRFRRSEVERVQREANLFPPDPFPG